MVEIVFRINYFDLFEAIFKEDSREQYEDDVIESSTLRT